MALIKNYKGITPEFGKDVFLAENATIIGKVTLGDECSVWYHAVLRGDVEPIVIGSRTNIQDGAILHCTEGISPTVVGDDCTIGHGAIVHGCRIGNRVLVGMGAIVLDEAEIRDDVIIGAGSVVLAKAVLESGWLYAGTPAKKIKPLSEAHLKGLVESAEHYVENQKTFRAEVHPVSRG